ncbi:hypothetical protein FRZ40_27220 [Paraburkholderia azotifigens]|uniref:Uncharacterized protein n=1 Tax=Paraburkholderia azotifigens TaxID=2057004 RepID=A0A5C6VF68_9BURK|nr:hypothetical protein FRZ40_27220 [Paraburkholderia azotifigens]
MILSCGAFGFLLRWHPRFSSGLLALPLCGAALTFFAAAKKVSKESGLTPPVLVFACGPRRVPHFTRQHNILPALPAC